MIHFVKVFVMDEMKSFAPTRKNVRVPSYTTLCGKIMDDNQRQVIAPHDESCTECLLRHKSPAMAAENSLGQMMTVPVMGGVR